MALLARVAALPRASPLGPHEDTRFLFFIHFCDPEVNRDGDRADIAPTVLKRFGVDLATLEPPLDGTPLDEPAERRLAPDEKPPAPWPLMGDAERAKPEGRRNKRADQ